MPGGNGTGPIGQGAGKGRGVGRGQNRGKMGGPLAAGPNGNCVCPKCGKTIPHVAGQPCNTINCPECGAIMTRG